MGEAAPVRVAALSARVAAIAAALACLVPLLPPELAALQGFWDADTAPRPTTVQWGEPRAGEDVLPHEVRAMVALLRDRGVVRFRESEGFRRSDESIRQRLAEAAYPIVLEAHADTVLLLPGEAPPPRCRLVEARPEAALADCR